MGGVRACVFLLVLVVNLELISGAPIFEDLWCVLFCDDDDINPTTTTASTEDPWDIFFDCRDCRPTRRRTTTTTPPSIPNPMTPAPFNFLIQTAPNGTSGLSFSIGQPGQLVMNIMPMGAAVGASTAAPAAATTAAASAATTTAATTAAAAATTAAATTAAPAAGK